LNRTSFPLDLESVVECPSQGVWNIELNIHFECPRGNWNIELNIHPKCPKEIGTLNLTYTLNVPRKLEH
jgi:hypothetical protein